MDTRGHSVLKKLFYTTLFAIAMAYLESTIVVYLRLLYYPQGFTFPIPEISSFVWTIEMGREAATLVMLLVIAFFLSENGREWFAYFAFNFGMWDIWYYIWLKLFLDWPKTLLDWDILFLLPVPWIGPVLAPVLVSLALIISAVILLYYRQIKLSVRDWIIEIVCGSLIISSFLMQNGRLSQDLIPLDYPWWLFFLGFISGCLLFIWRAFTQAKS